MRKIVLAVLLILALLGGIVAGTVIYEIISPTVTVTVTDLKLTLNVNVTTCLVDEVVWLNGTFTKEGVPQQGQEIFLCCDGVPTGDFDVTDVDGYYEFFFTVSQIKTYAFFTNTTVTVG